MKKATHTSNIRLVSTLHQSLKLRLPKITRSLIITERAPTRTFSWLKAPPSDFPRLVSRSTVHPLTLGAPGCAHCVKLGGRPPLSVTQRPSWSQSDRPSHQDWIYQSEVSIALHQSQLTWCLQPLVFSPSRQNCSSASYSALEQPGNQNTCKKTISEKLSEMRRFFWSLTIVLHKMCSYPALTQSPPGGHLESRNTAALLCRLTGGL